MNPVSNNILILSHHRKKAIKRCKFKAHIHYVLKKQKTKNNINLIFGTAFHDTMEVYYRQSRNITFDSLLKVFKRNMVTGVVDDIVLAHEVRSWIEIGEKILGRYYDLTKEKETFKIIDVEVPFFLSVNDQAEILFNSPDRKEQASNAYFILSGKIDLVIQVGDDIYFVDHKTTSQTQTRFKEQFLIDDQLLDYSIYGRWKYGDKFKGVMINGINKKIDNVDPPIFRDWYIYSEDEIYNALLGYLDTAQEYYTLSQAPHLMQTLTIDAFDCSRCEYLDVSIAKRKGEYWEQILDLYYEDIDKFDWEK